MPRARWGISSQDVDGFDRDSQFKPYSGPLPPLAVYHWVVKTLKYASATKDKLPQLRVGLELYPRDGFDEAQYEGYFMVAFLVVSERTTFRYVPFLDAIGVSGREFETQTVYDTDNNVTRIGKWRNQGDTLVAAQIKMGEDENGKPKREIGWIGEATDDNEETDDFEEDEYADE